MSRHDEVIFRQRDRLEWALLEHEPPIQPRPRVNEHLVKGAARLRQPRVDDERLRRRVVENHQGMSEETVSGGEIDDAAAAEEAPDPPRRLPRFVQLLAGQAAGMTHGACDAIEQRVAWKPLQVTPGEASFG